MNSLSDSNMTTISPRIEKKIQRCFFVSLAFVIVIPILCVVLGKTLHPDEFSYDAMPSSDDKIRMVSLDADLLSADLKQATIVLDWGITRDTCDPYDANSECAIVNIYFDENLLQHSDTNSSDPSDNNVPTDPTFVWNVTASYNILSNFPRFQTELSIFPHSKHSGKHTRSSDVYYPFDKYIAEVFAFARDASTQEPVRLFLDSTSGLAAGLKVMGDVANTSGLANDGIPEVIGVLVHIKRGTLVIFYSLVITIIFWLITLAICFVMIMTVGFGFRQRNEIVVVPVGILFAFIQLRSTMPGAPDGFGDILDFVGVLPCLVLLSICAVTMVGIYVFTDPAKDSRPDLTWSALVQTLTRLRNRVFRKKGSKYKQLSDSHDMLQIPLTDV
ncbi:uncharacterized protein EV420DRAFT_1574188 [Desarmillaria tabescens]|uniref:Uncharacterized protein n=1 Tax=Armillaria tabescens TaxID=1929756 RepID=A0AA39MSJ1_ARMTA|nr:uncharacterized protein EV420DRAFT_1574188 [Desarmillaria tabescens]KAK0444648.1 hypothetical protein EV420DRAFT_1574188 [Desarmillaria tabescens]